MINNNLFDKITNILNDNGKVPFKTINNNLMK